MKTFIHTAVKPLALSQKNARVMEDDRLRKIYEDELVKRKVCYRPLKINGKRMGVHRFTQALYYVAAYVYDNFLHSDPIPVKQEYQTTLF